MKKLLKKGAGVILSIAMVISSMTSTGAVNVQAASQGITISEAAGYAEGAYAEFRTGLSATGYNAYVKKASESNSSYVKLDNELIRKYPNCIRVDAVGLAAGDYIIKIVPVYDGTEKASEACVSETLNVYSHDRTGFAWVNGTASGAYKEDGTLKPNSIVLYVTEETKDKVTLNINGDKGFSNYVGIQNILNAYKKGKDSRSLDIRIIGQITDLAVLDKGDLLVDGNKEGLTIEGIGEDAVIDGFGIRVKGSDNVEIRNLGIMNVNSSEGDNIGLQQNNTHIWVHNCDFFYGDAGSDADQVKGDGALDTKTSTYITHSYNHFWDNGKCNLQGMKSEKENNYITYHHNWYDHSDSRHPRIRTCSVHSYNNYFDGNAKYGVGVTMGASAFVENNYFRNCGYPMLSSNQGSDITAGGIFSGETGGVIKSYNNHIEGDKAYVTYQQNATDFDAYEASTASEKVPSSVVTKDGGTTYNNFDTSDIMYSYTAQSPEDAKETVLERAGRVNGGDFKYDFSTKSYQQKDGNGVMQTVIADEYYHVDDELKAAIVNYKTKLIAVGGNPLGSGSSIIPGDTTEKETESSTEKQTTAKATESTTKTTQKATEKATEATTKATEKATETATKKDDATVSTEKGFVSVGGVNEIIYAQISGIKDSDVTGVSYTGTMSGTLSGQDFEYLVRDKGNGVRIDIPGVKPGTYTLTVTTKSGNFIKSGIVVTEQDRSGYAHFNYTAGVGAYNDDGTLKDNAIVLYVTDDNKNDVTLTYDGITVKGIGNILNSVGKECGEADHVGECKKTSGNKTIYAKANTNQGIIQKLAENNIPLVVRFIGTVSDSGLYEKGTFNASTGLIDGLTQYDGDDFGGSVGDNGHMARIKSGKDITLEGVGTDATIDGWGFHYMAESANPDLGKSFEVRNLIFINTPEDAIGMEGVQVSANVNSTLSASVERCWIHNNEFYCPDISNPAESDKSEGDGSVDFKRGQYFTCSYNYFEGCHKTNLVGSADSSLQYNLTYHHNYWKLCKARGPLTRNSNVHMYNNVFEGQTDYAMNVRANAYIFSEYNMFYMCKNPQRVDSGVIKSFGDSFSSCINDMGGTIVENKTDVVANDCKFAAMGIDYSKFDTDAKLSYIPTGDYELQTSVTEARKVIAACTGVLKENAVTPDQITESQISYVPANVTPINVTSLPETLTPGKLNKTVYAFTVDGTVNISVSFADDTYVNTGVLVNSAGECFLTGSGTVNNLPAGTYMIQPTNFQPGDGKTMTAGTFKQVTVNSINITSSDPNAHYHNFKLTDTVEATCEKEGSKIYTCSCGETKTEIIAKTAHKYGDWEIIKEATETDTGLKSHKCTVCGNEETQTIPAKGDSSDIDPVEPSGNSYSHNFTASGKTSDFYKITGSTVDNKGSVEYNGLKLTVCYKMESDNTITFNAPSDGKLTLVFGGSKSPSGKKVNINGTSYTCGTDGIVTVDVSKGTVTIAKGDAIFLFYMNYEPNSVEPTPTPEPEKKNGLQKSDDGNYYYYVDDVVDTEYTGFVNNENERYYVKNGKVDSNYTDVIQDGTDWVYVENGQVRYDYSGIRQNCNGWWRIEEGKVDFDYTGLADNEYGRFYIQNGKVNFNCTDVIQDGTDWVYVENGQVRYDYTGIKKNSEGWMRIKNGKVDFDYTGLADNEYGRFYIQNGKVNFNYTDIIQDETDWVYVENGQVRYDYTGIRKNAYGWWRIRDGKVDFNFTGIASNEYGEYYINGGKVMFNYNGIYIQNDITYTIKDGEVINKI